MKNKLSMLNLVHLSYKKLKAHIYNDYNTLYLRSKIAEFESSEKFEAALRRFADELEVFKTTQKSEYIDGLIEQVTYHTLPKKIKKNSSGGNDKPILVTNDITQDANEIEKVMFVINCPIEIHILSILWIMRVGKFLDENINQDHSYGNRLHRGELETHPDEQRRLFVPYFENYKKWRDTGIDVAKNLHKKKIDSVILTLDIRNYYYSVDFDLNLLNSTENILKYEYEPTDLYLNSLLYKIHEKYRELFKVDNKFLPIGLLSSGILANFVLEPVDTKICEQVKPAYYGRYVDDFIVVLANVKIKNDGNQDGFLNDCFSGYKVFQNDIGKKEIKLESEWGKFYFQHKKVRLINVSASQPISVIEEFEKNIKETSSEARLLVEEADLLSNFDSESSKISYSDTLHKLRSIDAFNIDKLGASSYLTNLIEATKITHKFSTEDINKFQQSVLSYFRGYQGVESFSLWEKVVTFYYIHEQYDHLFAFVKSLVTEITKTDVGAKFESPFKENSNTISMPMMDVQTELLSWLLECIALAHALNPSQHVIFKESIQRIAGKDVDSSNGISLQISAILLDEKKLSLKASRYRDSNLLRHKYVTIPLVNYCEQDACLSFTDTSFNEGLINFTINQKKQKYSPRYITFHEIQLFNHFRFLISKEEFSIDQCVDQYIEMNLLSSKNENVKNKFPQMSKIPDSGWNEVRIKCESQDFNYKMRLAIANYSIDMNDITNSVLGAPNLHYNRLSRLNTVLNMAARDRSGVDLILLPEATVPIQWVDYLARFAQKHQIGIITGIEHFNMAESEVANFVCHILPFTADKRKNVCVTFRNKENFSPSEKKWLSSNGKTEFGGLKQHCIYKWAGLHFTTFNCFEVTDLKKRASVVSLIDMLVVVENNKDTEYFSSIVESSARDIHCIVTQVNNSKYGDSRVCLPAKSYEKDQLRIRGGKNETILVEELDVYGLRLYQMMGEQAFQFHPKCEIYKPLPPNFQMQASRKVKKLKN